MKRECGSCSMCCKVYEIGPLEKSADVWCQYCVPGKGCTIYERRPNICSSFECRWKTDDEIPDWMKPSESKIVLTAEFTTRIFETITGYELPHVIIATVSASQKNVLEPGTKQRKYLDQLAKSQMVVIQIGNGERKHLWDGREYTESDLDAAAVWRKAHDSDCELVPLAELWK